MIVTTSLRVRCLPTRFEKEHAFATGTPHRIVGPVSRCFFEPIFQVGEDVYVFRQGRYFSVG